MFTELPGNVVLLRVGGVFKQVSRVCDYREAPNVVVRGKFKGPEFV